MKRAKDKGAEAGADTDAESKDAESGGPVMLALSTFRHSEKAIETVLAKAAAVGQLVIAYVADVNLARYLIGSGAGILEGLKEKCEEEMLEEHKERGKQRVEVIAKQAKERGLEVSTHVEVGRFALVCLEIVKKTGPSLIVTTRSKRPAWVRRFFGSPVDYLIEHAGCPVIEA